MTRQPDQNEKEVIDFQLLEKPGICESQIVKCITHSCIVQLMSNYLVRIQKKPDKYGISIDTS
jgi:hypothetical protein